MKYHWSYPALLTNWPDILECADDTIHSVHVAEESSLVLKMGETYTANPSDHSSLLLCGYLATRVYKALKIMWYMQSLLGFMSILYSHSSWGQGRMSLQFLSMFIVSMEAMGLKKVNNQFHALYAVYIEAHILRAKLRMWSMTNTCAQLQSCNVIVEMCLWPCSSN